MKSFLNNLFTLCLLLCTAQATYAYDFEVDGIYYNKLTENTVEVTYNKYNEATENYTGNIAIPSTFIHDEKIYTVTSIGDFAFAFCDNLTSVTIPDGVISIDSCAFLGCPNLTSITIPNSVTSIKQAAFHFCGLTSIAIPNSVTKIESGAFDWCFNLTSVTIPNGITSIEPGTFCDCHALTSITIPNSVTSIGLAAFERCNSLTSIIIPNNVTAIGERAFYECSSLTSIAIPNGVTLIEYGTFYGCDNLVSIYLPHGITKIGEHAFANCTKMKKIVCLSDTPPECDTDALKGISRTDCMLYVPMTSGLNYQNTSPWSEFTNIVSYSAKTCETPTITFDNTTMQLNFSCATEGAECHYSITSEDIQSGKTGDNAQLTGVYDITAYASATGYYNSETTTAKLCWLNIEGETTGVLNANMQRGLIVTTLGESIIVKGTVNGGVINVYNAAGSLVMNINTTDGETIINGHSVGNVYIVKIGGTSVKVAL